MTLKTIQTMLATAPASANWWSTNKESITKTWKLWERVGIISGLSSLATLMVSGALSAASSMGIIDNQYPGAIVFCGCLLLMCGTFFF